MNRYFRIARDMCLLSNNRVRFGAVLVINSGVILTAFNSDKKTHPMLRRHYPDFAKTAHAELRCLALYNQYVRGKLPSGSCLYVYREDKLGRQRNAMPCYGCWAVLKQSGLKRVRFSTETSFEEMRL